MFVDPQTSANYVQVWRGKRPTILLLIISNNIRLYVEISNCDNQLENYAGATLIRNEA